MPIRILNTNVASKIAAGEVVQRPASAVKELIENSLDAGATQITVEVQGGGVRLLRVIDNGEGIPPDEVETAFERFATSKVSTADDLESISSLGFRGEALPSIAAVSEVTMVTRSRDELAGTFLNIKDCAVIENAKRGCPPGTTVTVRNLFRNFPARLKFLKSTTTENGHISHLVTEYSLAFPEVRFILVLDGHTSFRSPGSGNLREAVASVYGLTTARSLLEIESAEEKEDIALPKVIGLTSPPSLTRASRNYMSFFVNRRWVQSRMLAYAVEEAYHGLLMTGKHPLAVVNILLPPEEIDVNVHPAKSEVRFQHERDVFAAVQKAVRNTILAQSPIPTLEALPHPTPQFFAATSTAAPFATGTAGGETPTQFRPSPSDAVHAAGSLPILRTLGQIANTYIIAEGPDGMYLIDQHAAHERILFEKIKAESQQQKIEVQGMLQPVTVDLTVSQQELLQSRMEALSEYGFAIEHFGERTYLIRSVPALLKGQNTAQSLIEILDSLDGVETDDWREKIAISLACHSAALAGQILNPDEMRELVRQLEQTSQPHTCPHGRPTMIHFSASQLEKGFGRR
ncbi:DNA mismatch repair endonuclease MutL [Chloroflexota bacterium]